LTERLHDYVSTPVVRPGHRHVYHQYVIRVPAQQRREDWIEALRARGVGTGVHYPCAIHEQPYYRELGYTPVLPHSEAAAREVLSLPVYPSLTQAELDTIAAEVIALCQ
jgi:dTDP-4-amino-4,6-dideoxygalactose transaminase